MATGYMITEKAARRTAETCRRVLGSHSEARQPKGPKPDPGGGGCDTQDAAWQITLFGNTTGGTWGLSGTIISSTGNVTATATFQWNDTAATIRSTMIAAFSNLNTGNFSVQGGPAPNATIVMSFSGTAGALDQTLPVMSWALTGGAGIGVIILKSQLGHA